MTAGEEHWYLAIGSDMTGRNVVGMVYKSLTSKLLHSRYVACEVLTVLRERGVDVSGTEVAIMRDGEVQAKDTF